MVYNDKCIYLVRLFYIFTFNTTLLYRYKDRMKRKKTIARSKATKAFPRALDHATPIDIYHTLRKQKFSLPVFVIHYKRAFFTLKFDTTCI